MYTYSVVRTTYYTVQEEPPGVTNFNTEQFCVVLASMGVKLNI